MEVEIGKVLREHIEHERVKRGISQRKMAEILYMDTRSYAGIEYGEWNCGTLTAVMIILHERDSLLSALEDTLMKCAAQTEEASFV